MVMPAISPPDNDLSTHTGHVGDDVGALVGTPVGTVVGTAVGEPVGTTVGSSVGAPVGALVGALALGDDVGEPVLGTPVVGAFVGDGVLPPSVLLVVGAVVGMFGDDVGAWVSVGGRVIMVVGSGVGARVGRGVFGRGRLVGFLVGLGALVGLRVGLLVGFGVGSGVGRGRLVGLLVGAGGLRVGRGVGSGVGRGRRVGLLVGLGPRVGLRVGLSVVPGGVMVTLVVGRLVLCPIQFLISPSTHVEMFAIHSQSHWNSHCTMSVPSLSQ